MKKINEQTKIKIYSVETNAPVCQKIKKKDDTKIFEIKKLNNVGADASVRLKQNKNNIITFEKHKPNIVGVGVPDDPKEKHKLVNKLTSNIPTSNLQFPTSNTAITLVALVITIVLNCCGAAMV